MFLRTLLTRKDFLGVLSMLAAAVAFPTRLFAFTADAEVDSAMSNVYTHAMWKVKTGNVERFLEAWSNLATTFSNLPRPPIHGTLIQSIDDPRLFYSFGPWQSMADIEEMRASAEAQKAIAEVVELCESATPGTFDLVQHVTVRP